MISVPSSAPRAMTGIGQVLLGPSGYRTPAGWHIEVASDRVTEEAYRSLRREVFVGEQGLFREHDQDDVDQDDRRIVLVARADDGAVIGGVRLAPVSNHDYCGADIGWWAGSRLVVAPAARRAGGVGPALIRAACSHAEANGVIRFDAAVQVANEPLFARLGWQRVGEPPRPAGPVSRDGEPPRPAGPVSDPARRAGAHSQAEIGHVPMRWPIRRFEVLARQSKAHLGPLLAGLQLGGPGFVGDDGAPVPGTDVIAACDAIVPSLVERDPEWAGWCSILVNINDLAAMGAEPIGVLDALGARDASFAARVLSGIRRASAAYGVPVLGGHTQLGVPAALSVTALGRAERPIRAGGATVGHAVTLTADVSGHWRRGYTGQQWDSTTGRSREELADLVSLVRRGNPAAAKDVSMAGLVGTVGMLAEAGNCAAEIDVSAVVRPADARLADWLSCFPGFAMVTSDVPGRALPQSGAALSAPCGSLTSGRGVSLRWPDGELTAAVSGAVTGLGPA